MAQLLLVHGAFHGAWCWERLLPELAARGVDAHAIDLPFTSAADDRGTVAAAIDRLSAGGEPVVALGHSFGGAVISAAAGAASHLIFLTAIMAEEGQTIDMLEAPGMASIKMEGEEAWVERELATMAFYHRCSPADAEWATSRVRPMPVATLLSAAPERATWREVPSTYIVCTDDQVILPDTQRQMAAWAGTSLEIDSDHSPFLSMPPDLADIIAGVVETA